MEIDVRPVARLRDLPAARAVLGPVVEELCASPVDLSRLRVIYDWIQYRENFRDPVICRPVLTGSGERTDLMEVAIDLRRVGVTDIGLVRTALTGRTQTVSGTQPGPTARVALEPWTPGSASCIWRFNNLYWQALSQWEKATGREYEQALPGGASEARNVEAARGLILELFRIWDDLAARRALPDELYVLEIGVGNGGQARTWLDAFVELDRTHGREYYRRLHYLMGDYSAHVLDRARQAVAHHGDRVNALVLDATRPTATLGFLAGKTFLVYVSNVYDNLPTDELACIHGRMYQVEVRAFVGADDADRIAERFGTSPRQLTALVHRLLAIGPELLSESMPRQFADTSEAVSFWRDVWKAVRLAERYVPLDGLDSYRITPSLTGELLRPLLESDGDVRMHVSNGAVSSFADTLPLLHPFGRLVCHDLFLTDRHQYRTGFYGPGKYDGSVVNWVNGPLLQILGSRRGFDVCFMPFPQRPAATVKTLVAQARD